MSAVSSMQLLVSEIFARAKHASWQISQEGSLENAAELHSNALLRALEAAPSQEQYKLPEHRVALLVRGCVRLLITAIDEESEFLSACRGALWWAGAVRGSLHPISRADLHLFIVASFSPGKEESALRDRSRIEADERICRKHVWLPALETRVADFLDATFLARPWQRDQLLPQSLDPLQKLVETAGLPSNMATAWVNALSSMDDLRTDVVAEVLSSLYEDADGK